MITHRQVTTLGFIALALLVTAALVLRTGPATESKIADGMPLIQGIDPAKINAIELQSRDKKTTLERDGEGNFRIKERHNYPASIERVNSLIRNCTDVLIAREVSNSVDAHEELGVKEFGDETATVRFLDKDGKALVGLVRGNMAEGNDGPYVRRDGEDTVYAAEKYFGVDTGPDDYIEKQLLTVNTEEIAKVDVKIGKDAYALIPTDSGKFVLQNAPKGKCGKKDEVSGLSTAISSIRIIDAVPLDGLKVEWTATHTATLKTGMAYTVRIGKSGDKHYINMTATPPPAGRIKASASITKDEKEDKLKEKSKVLEAAKTAELFTTKHAAWAYEMSSWKTEQLAKPLADLLEDMPTEPEEIAASHILISYKGAQNSKTDRSKKEAQKQAKEILQKVKARGADFAALAKEYSDGPTKSKGGDLGTFPKGAMSKNFEEAAWKLKVGQTSGIVETPFGFHIIKRTK